MSIEGRHLGEFETLERLGQGGMGAVYKARQKSLRRTVALKTLQASLAEDQEYIARFQQEAVAAAALNHPNLVQVYSAGEDEGLHWFAMEYVEGESAQTRLKREGRLDPSDAVAIVIHVATALEYGWRKAALIHRDIKPDNIFLSEDGEVKLGDLGLAKSVGQTQGLTVTGTMMGTPNYISPEQAQGMGDVDLRADIYSLGCTLYHLLSGQPPYAGTSAVAILMKHVSAPVPDLSSVWPECPPELAALVMKMMRKVPAERPQNYAEVIAELRRIYDLLTAAAIGSEVAASTPQSMVEREPASPEIAASAAPLIAAPRKSRLPLYVGLATGAVALAGGASLLFRPKEKQHTNLTPVEAQTVIPQSETKISPATAKRIAEPVSPTSPAPARAVESWENMLGEGTIREMKGAVEQTAQGLLISGAGEVLTPFRRRDGAVRLRAIFGGMRPVLRARDGHEGRYELHAGGDGKSIIARTITPGAAIPPQTYTLSRPMVVGEYYEIELRTVGRMVTVKHNGNVLGSIVDDTLSEGRFGFASTLGTADGQPTVVATLELLDLTPPPAEPWQNVLGDPANLELSGGAERVGEGLRFTEYGSAILRTNHGPQRDGAVRMRTTFGDAYPQLRARNTGTAAYTLHAQTDNFIVLGCYVYLSKQFTTLRALRPRKLLQRGEEYELELRVVGNVLTAKLNGEDLGSVADDTVQEGRFGSVGGNNGTPEPLIVKNLEVLNLDAVDNANTALPAAKDTPFVNSLGMKFVPVPVAGGPTAGQRVLFSVWHTRVQDYAAYASAKKVDDSWKKQGQGRLFAGRDTSHPVVGVNWEDARAFCQWLTEKETAEGKLPTGLQYRLPTDEEWSWAVGLPPESGATPREKDRKNRLDFSWGRDDSPPRKVGNFADESFRREFSPDETVKDDENKKLWMEGYNDGYPTTSPVGSFPANSYGLYDMGGNAWQFCEDWFDATNTQRVLRGQSWGNRAYPSSIRNYSVPGRRTNAIGFRCVIAALER